MSTTTKPVIHVGVDGSWRDNGALEWALQEALLRHEPLRAVHVIDEQVRRSPYWESTVIDDAAMELVKDVQQHLDANRGSLDHEMDLVVGPPAETLNRLAAGSRMLVVGRRGVGAFRRLLIGSTSEAVASDSPVPVVVVPDRWKPADHAGPVVLALDESGADQAAMDFAVTAATERQLSLRLIHVWDLPKLYSWQAADPAGLAEEVETDVRRHVNEIAERLRMKYPELVVEADVWRGHPVDCVVRATDAWDAQLLVVGGRRRRLLTATLLGSVARGAVQHAKCPVAVVHEPVAES